MMRDTTTHGLIFTRPLPQGSAAPASGAFWTDEYGWLVPVEPCEHGNIDGHWADLTDHEIAMAAPFQSHEKWCPGAGIGGDE